MLGHRNAFHIASGLDLDSYLSRNVLRPMLKRVERDDADRIVESSRHELDDDGFNVRAFNFCLAINTAPHTKAIDYEISGLISPVRHHPASSHSWAYVPPVTVVTYTKPEPGLS